MSARGGTLSWLVGAAIAVSCTGACRGGGDVELKQWDDSPTKLPVGSVAVVRVKGGSDQVVDANPYFLVHEEVVPIDELPAHIDIDYPDDIYERVRERARTHMTDEDITFVYGALIDTDGDALYCSGDYFQVWTEGAPPYSERLYWPHLKGEAALGGERATVLMAQIGQPEGCVQWPNDDGLPP